MKYGSLKAVCLVIWAFVAVMPGFGDEHTVDYESIILESFDGNTEHSWPIDGTMKTFDFEWKLDASKFATKNDDEAFPQMTYVPSWPVALFGNNRDGKDLKSLGIHGRFDRRGYNWIDLYPVKTGEDEPFELPIPGRISYVDLWVWGSNLDFYIEAYFRDHNGVVHNIRMGNIGYTGWANLRANIPNNVAQSKRILPRLAGLTFVKFRIWTQPTEKVGDFYIYFDQFKVLTDTFESLFDGDELADPERVQELWANGNN
ncbi:MAG: flagellar filament outer layer protein FlaA [Treponema sp.]|jgi:hypothetical protein|nr:flagellar filament outer layer protein FlaA [Treponema sp.]